MVDDKVGKIKDEPGDRGGETVLYWEPGLRVDMGALTGTLQASRSCTTDDWLPPALFWSPLPCWEPLLFSLAWVICSLGESGTATSEVLGDMDDDALCQGLDIGCCLPSLLAP